MKKLMIAAAAAFCGTVFGLESANIVGYQNIANDISGYCQRGATFNGIAAGLDGYDIQSIVPQKPENAAADLEDGGAIIQQVNDFGETIAEYYYFIAGSTQSPDGKAGWYYLDNESGTYKLASVKFSRGEGFLYQAPYFEDANEEEVGSSFMSSGEVKMEAKSVLSEVSGYCHRANYRPVELSIQKLTPKGIPEAATELEDGGAIIQEINDFGETVAEYYYFIAGSTQSPDGKAGWYYLDSESGTYKLSEKVFSAGEGFLYQAPYFENDAEEEIGSYLEFSE